MGSERQLVVEELEALEGPGGGGGSREACSEVATFSASWRSPGQQGLRRKRVSRLPDCLRPGALCWRGRSLTAAVAGV